MSRRKNLAEREPNGRVQRVTLIPAGEVRRLRDAALAGMRDPQWGTEIGRLFLAGKIDEVEFSVAKKWAELGARYGDALCAPSPDPKAVNMDRGGGQSADPDSPEGRREARRHERAVEAFIDAVKEVQSVKGTSIDILRRVCERGEMCVGHEELLRLVNTLRTLRDFWGLTARRKSDVR